MKVGKYSVHFSAEAVDFIFDGRFEKFNIFYSPFEDEQRQCLFNTSLVQYRTPSLTSHDMAQKWSRMNVFHALTVRVQYKGSFKNYFMCDKGGAKSEKWKNGARCGRVGGGGNL